MINSAVYIISSTRVE